jgi:hypothetical protein
MQWAVDTRFWRPMTRVSDMICSVGQEMPDYGTLLKALNPLGIRCHIATGTGIFGSTSDKGGEPLSASRHYRPE